MLSNKIKLRHYEKATKFEKITHLFWQNSCFYSAPSKQVGDFFKFLWTFQKSWTLIEMSCNTNDILRIYHHSYLFFIKKWYARQIYLVDKSVWCKTTCKGLQGINMVNYHQTRFWQKYTYVLYTVPVWWRKTLET